MNQAKNNMWKDAANLAWLLLVVATGVGWWLSQASQANTEGWGLATAAVIVEAFIKVWIIAFQFMELRHAPRWLRHTFDLWVVVVCVVLVGILLG